MGDASSLYPSRFHRRPGEPGRVTTQRPLRAHAEVGWPSPIVGLPYGGNHPRPQYDCLLRSCYTRDAHVQVCGQPCASVG